MKPPPFSYHRPDSVAQTIELLATLDDTKILAGGQSLMPMMNFRYLTPAHLLDVNRIDALQGISADDHGLTVGAMTRQCALEQAPEIDRHAPLVKAALTHVGHVQTRNRGTLGGSLCHLDPAAELPGVMLALDAELEVGSHAGRRRVPMAEWSVAYMTPALEEDEIVTKVSFPVPKRAGYQKFPNPASRYAIVGVMIAETASGMRVAVTGAAGSVFRVPEMESALASNFSPGALDGIQVAADDFNEDLHASAEYRAHLVGVMAKRAVAAAGGAHQGRAGAAQQRGAGDGAFDVLGHQVRQLPHAR